MDSKLKIVLYVFGFLFVTLPLTVRIAAYFYPIPLGIICVDEAKFDFVYSKGIIDARVVLDNYKTSHRTFKLRDNNDNHAIDFCFVVECIEHIEGFPQMCVEAKIKEKL